MQRLQKQSRTMRKMLCADRFVVSEGFGKQMKASLKPEISESAIVSALCAREAIRLVEPLPNIRLTRPCGISVNTHL